MAGKRNASADATYNARRRYRRASERYLKKAEKASGATAERYRALAQENYKKVANLYTSKQKRSKSFQELENQFGKINTENTTTEMRQKLQDASKSSLESFFDDRETRRQEEARALLSNESISSRIFGGFVDIWKDKATVTDSNGREKVDNRKILPAIYEHLGVDNLADALERIEDVIGSRLYELNDTADNIYEYVKVMIQKTVKEGTFIQ